jgi:hypothetical protein
MREWKMAVVFPNPPSLNEQMLGRHLAQIADSPLSGAKGQLAGVTIDALSYTAPHQNWYSTLDALIAGRLLADAQAGSWRYLLCEENRAVGEFEVESDDQQMAQRFLAVHHGSAAQLSVDALRFAESIPEVGDRDFEARFLKVPALNFSAIWLHRDDQDLIIPVTGHSEALTPRNAYSESDVVSALRPRAEEARRGPGGRPGR